MPKKTSVKNTAGRYQNGSMPSSGSSEGSKSASASKQNSTSSTNSKNRKANLKDILAKELNDVYSAEKQLLEALPEMARAAESEDLQDAFEHHAKQTQKHVERLEKVFERTGIQKTDETCEAMEGLIKENKEVISEFDRSPARDSALIIGAQKVEHYEIASYGSLCELADVLGMHKVCDILDRTLEEEEDTDRDLTDIARHVNDEAAEMHADEYEEENYSYSSRQGEEETAE